MPKPFKLKFKMLLTEKSNKGHGKHLNKIFISARVSFGSGATAQTFLALGDANAGYQSSGDAVIRLQYAGALANLTIIGWGPKTQSPKGFDRTSPLFLLGKQGAEHYTPGLQPRRRGDP